MTIATFSLSISTPIGIINGFINSTAPNVAQFLGILFAKPPIGTPGWLPAIPKTKIEGAIGAKKFAVNCPQYNAADASVYALDAPEFNITPSRLARIV